MANSPRGVERLMDEAEQHARRMYPGAVRRIGMIRRCVLDAAHLHDDLLSEIAALADDCVADLPCSTEMAEAGTACATCQISFKLRCAGVEPGGMW
jgi:hypothetical protein